jgi:PQQ-like domain
LWVSRYNGPASKDDVPAALIVSPSGRTLFVTGTSSGSRSGDDYATIAYSAATGARRWTRRYNGAGNGRDIAAALAASPGGGTVFVTGASLCSGPSDDYATIAYNAAAGARQWTTCYNRPAPAGSYDAASSVAVSPAGGTVYVSGTSGGGFRTAQDYATVTYAAATGALLRVDRYTGPGSRNDYPSSETGSPVTGAVYVTGTSRSATTGQDCATIAYHG